MIEELAYDVQLAFPDEDVPVNTLRTIYFAAKLNRAKQLVALLNTIKNDDLKEHLINLKFDEIDGQSVTPLTMAAMAGNTTFVHTLLTQYKVDMEQECNVVFDGLVVYGATALWVAAGMGHMQIVKMLVHFGANVNHNTKAQSSPLRAACYEGRLDIALYLIAHGADVNLANTYNNTCIMIAAYKGFSDLVHNLLEQGADPDKQALCGATAMHYAAESGHVEVCRVLLDHGAKLLTNENALSPIMVAAERTNEECVMLFIEREGLLEKSEIIDALELLGASYANDKDNYSLEKAYSFLQQAMELRYSDSENIVRKHIIDPVYAYDHWLETENMQELQAIRLNHHSMHMETLTIRERLLGKNHPELPQPIVYRGAIMADQSRFEQCLKLWNYALDLRMTNNVDVERDLLRFAQLFSQMLRMSSHLLDFPFVLSILAKCQQEIESNLKKIANPGPKDVPSMLEAHNEQNMITALYLIKIITKLLPHISENSVKMANFDYFYSVMTSLVKRDIRLQDGQTLLHLAVNSLTPVDTFYTIDVCKFPCYRTALLLIHSGASVTAVDCERNTVLHTLVASLPNLSERCLVQAERIIKLLAESDVHLDAVNAHGQTALDFNPPAALANLIQSYQNSNMTLKCLSARYIATNRLKYKGSIPIALESYIQMHSADKFCA